MYRYLLVILLLFAGCEKMPDTFQPSDDVLSEISTMSSDLETVSDIRVLMGRFRNIAPNASPETPTIESIFSDNFVGDCRTAAILAQWGCEQIGMETIIVSLWKGKPYKSDGHQICIAWDRENEWHLFSNNEYGLIYSSDWFIPVNEYFKNRYVNIEVQKTITHDQGIID